MRMSGLWIAPSHCCVGGGLVFCFGLFSCLRRDEWSSILSHALCWGYVGWDGMRMGEYIVGLIILRWCVLFFERGLAVYTFVYVRCIYSGGQPVFIIRDSVGEVFTRAQQKSMQQPRLSQFIELSKLFD
jgi:hypothetical protein